MSSSDLCLFSILLLFTAQILKCLRRSRVSNLSSKKCDCPLLFYPDIFIGGVFFSSSGAQIRFCLFVHIDRDWIKEGFSLGMICSRVGDFNENTDGASDHSAPSYHPLCLSSLERNDDDQKDEMWLISYANER